MKKAPLSGLLLLLAGILTCWVWLRLAPDPGPEASSRPDPSASGSVGNQAGAGEDVPTLDSRAPSASGGDSLASVGTSSSPGLPGDGPGVPASPAREIPPAASGASGAPGPDDDSVAGVLEGVDLSDPATRAWAAARIAEIQEARQDAVREKAARLGIPLRTYGPGNRITELYDFRGDVPVYRLTRNKNAAISSAANLLHGGTYNLTGTGMKVGVWDGGSVRATHQELTGRVTKKNTASAEDDHATHVAGTIIASGVQANAKGMAPGASVDSYDWTNDYSEMTSAGASSANDTTRLRISNHSYGYFADSTDMGRYESEARSVDAVAAALPYYLPFWAAGNDQDYLTQYGGYQSITYNGLAKNVLTVGAVNDAVSGGVRNVGSATMSSFSSWGPCDDGRIKPDLVANGVSVYSTVKTSNTAYDTYSGTSMATPSAAGSAALVAQLYAREFSGQVIRASTLKALLIHTADELGNTGPDYKTGWGLINAKAAADLILSSKASQGSPRILENSLTNSTKTRTHTFTWDGSSAVRVTLAWTDPAGAAQTAQDSRTPNLVHNLDLKLTAPNGTTVHNPYVMPFVGTWTSGSMGSAATTGKNNVDNVEQVRITTGQAQTGIYTVTVSLDGSLTTSSQTYSLIITGSSTVQANPPPNVTLTAPQSGTAVLPNAPVALAASATDFTATGATGTISKVEFFQGSTLVGTDTSAPYTASWTPTTPGVYQLTAKATDSENAAATSAAVTVYVLSGNGAPSVSSFTPTSGIPGSSVTLTGQNFANITAVRFNGVASPFFTENSLTSLTAEVPGAATTGLIEVVSSFGTGTSASPFTVILPPMVISQVYGGGGQSGSVYQADYIELHNRSNAPVNLTGWSVQYASSSGTTWTVTPLSGTIAAGKFYLIRMASGATGAALPAADLTGSTFLSVSSGKVALRDSTTAFTGVSALGQAGYQDMVGYGSASGFEGSAPAPAPSVSLAIFRAGAGATDTGDNAADFGAGHPNPRNSAGSGVVPVISSAGSASGQVDSAFSYQILASNMPTSFGATNLPAGLSVNPGSGVISGTPTTSGTFNVTLSATNAGGTATKALTLTIAPAPAPGPVVIFTENMGTMGSDTAISSAIFQNQNVLTFNGTATMRTSSPSENYAGASGGGCVFFHSTVGRDFVISEVNTLGYSDLQLSFGHHKNLDNASTQLAVEVSSDGINYASLSYSRAAGGGTINWAYLTASGSIPSTSNLRIRFRQTSATYQFRIDDVKLTGVVANPVITPGNTPPHVNTTYGSPTSSPATFTVAGTDLSAGILVTAPAGFEISQTSGGASGYAGNQTVGSGGSIEATTLYLRLAAGLDAGSYSGNIVCTSPGAATVQIPVTPSEVRRKVATVTAQDRTKAFGSTLVLGTSAFTPSGMVGSETIGAVTLAADGGTAVHDAVGTYTITPSAATGGTFNPVNYDLTYLPGTLTVTGQTLTAWLGGAYSGNDALPGADPDRNGLSHLQEYFYGLTPGSGVGGVRPWIEIEDGQLSFFYRRGKNISGVTGSVEWSNVLGSGASWSSSGLEDTLVSDEGTYEWRRAELTLTPGDLRKFLRIQITTP